MKILVISGEGEAALEYEQHIKKNLDRNVIAWPRADQETVKELEALWAKGGKMISEKTVIFAGKTLKVIEIEMAASL